MMTNLLLLFTAFVINLLFQFLACISFTLFILGSTELTNHITDPFVCVIFGICLIFPIFVLSGTTKHASNLMVSVNKKYIFLTLNSFTFNNTYLSEYSSMSKIKNSFINFMNPYDIMTKLYLAIN